jgi:hypothetical protein
MIKTRFGIGAVEVPPIVAPLIRYQISSQMARLCDRCVSTRVKSQKFLRYAISSQQRGA